MTGGSNLRNLFVLNWKLMEIWRGLHRGDIFPLTVGSAFRWLRSADALFEPTKLRRLIERHLPYRNLEDAPVPVHVMATSLAGLPCACHRGRRSKLSLRARPSR